MLVPFMPFGIIIEPMLAAVGFFIWGLPIFIAYYYGHPKFIGVCLLNIFLGWTGIGWIIALIWAIRGK